MMTTQAAAAVPLRRPMFLRDLSFLLLIPMVSTLYGILNNDERGVHSLMTDLDRVIPFAPAFVLPYLAWYAFILVAFVYLCKKDRTSYYQTLISMLAGFLVSYAVYYFYQTTVQRPMLLEQDVLSKLVRYVYTTDQPYNCFPSIHVLTSYLMLRGFKGRSAIPQWISAAVWVTAVTIIISTLFVKQHVLMDVLGAIVLSEMLRSAVKMFVPDAMKEAKRSWRPTRYSWLTMRRKL